MEEDEIRKNLESQIGKWLESKRSLGIEVSLTTGAIDTIFHILKSIEKDPSPSWHKERRDISFNNLQRMFVDMLPNMLNELLYYRGYYHPYQFLPKVWKRIRIAGPVKISTWEILHQISDIIDRWCFIPKEEM